MRLLHATPYNAGSMTFFIPKGTYGSFFIVFEGTNIAALNTTLPDLGTVQLTINGKPVINVPAELLSKLNNLYGGVATFSNVAGGAVLATIFIPCGTFFDSRNVYHITDKDDAYFKLDFAELASATGWNAGFVKVYGKDKDGIQNYLYNLISRNVVSSGVSTLADTHEVENIVNMYVDNTGIIDKVLITKDGESLVDAAVSDVQAYSDFIHQVETTLDLLAIEFAESGDIREAIGGSLTYNYLFNGAGTLEQYFGSIDFTPAKTVESARDLKQRVSIKVSKSKNVPKILPRTLPPTPQSFKPTIAV